jgi:hypothetical protein
MYESKKITWFYKDLVHILFEMIGKTPTDQSIVLATAAEVVKPDK